MVDITWLEISAAIIDGIVKGVSAFEAERRAEAEVAKNRAELRAEVLRDRETKRKRQAAAAKAREALAAKRAADKAAAEAEAQRKAEEAAQRAEAERRENLRRAKEAHERRVAQTTTHFWIRNGVVLTERPDRDDWR